MKSIRKDKYLIKATIGYALILISAALMFGGGMMALYSSAMKLVVDGGVALMFVGFIMAIINIVAGKIHGHQITKEANKDGK